MATKLWKEILGELEPTVSGPYFNAMLKPTTLQEEAPGQYSVMVPKPYHKQWVEKEVLPKIKKLLEDRDIKVEMLRVVVRKTPETEIDDLPLLSASEPESGEETAAEAPDNPFNGKYTLESFIVGNNNRLAFAAAQAVADRPGEAYNPLFIYGGVGLGKTHLMQAIGNHILRQNPKKKVVFTSCETFTSEFIEALQNKTINEFKRKYRSIDVFLVDDIQFLANKEGTQEEFFHTFNTLHQANRQIVVTADRMPREIKDLEERLTSRFGWGLVADIQSPNFETRVAILQAKAAEMSLDVDPKVIEYIATNVSTNVRELEGSLITLATTAKIEAEPLTLALAERLLKEHRSEVDKSLSTKKILHMAAAHFGVEIGDILGRKRQKELVYPRQVVMYLLRELMHQSYPQIGEALGGKDHTTIMHGVEKIERLMREQTTIENDVKDIIAKLKS